MLRPSFFVPSFGMHDEPAPEHLYHIERKLKHVTTAVSQTKTGAVQPKSEATETPMEKDAKAAARPLVAHPYLCLMGLFLGGFTGMYSETALNIALPNLSAAFGVELAIAQWLVVGYMLAIGVVLPFSSLLVKWVPAKRLTLFALGAFFVGAIVSGVANDFAVAMVGRVVQGIGTGLVLPLMFSMVMTVMPPQKLGTAMGITALVVMSAPAIGPTLAGFLISALSWRWVLFSFAIVLVFAIAFTVRFAISPYQITKPHIDALSIVTSCIGFGCVVFGVGVTSLYGWASVQVIASLVVGIVALVCYAIRQTKMDVPVIDLKVFKHQGFRVGAVCMMINFGITLSAMYVLPQFYQNVLLMAVALTGIVMLPAGLINAAVSVFSGKLYDKIGARIPAIGGFCLSAIGALMLLTASTESPVWFIVVCHIVMMLGVPLAMSPCQTHALASLPRELSTDGSTALNTMQQVVGAICTAVATSLLTVGQSAYMAAGDTDTAQAFSQGAHMGFMFTLALALVGLLLALLRISSSTTAGNRWRKRDR